MPGFGLTLRFRPFKGVRFADIYLDSAYLGDGDGMANVLSKKSMYMMEPIGHLQRLTSMSDPIYDNLLSIYNDATPEEYDTGREWYADARATIAALADRIPGFSPITFAGVVAALSPRVRWSTNLDAAMRICRAAANRKRQPIVAGLTINRDRAWRIAKTGAFSHLKGPKVRAFAANLTGDEYAVTIDVWMLAAAGVKYANVGNRRAIERAIRAIAEEHELSPAKVQAIIWTVIRDRWALDSHGTIES